MGQTTLATEISTNGVVFDLRAKVSEGKRNGNNKGFRSELGNRKTKGSGSELGSGFKVGRQVLINVNGAARPIDVGHEVWWVINLRCLMCLLNWGMGNIRQCVL